VTDFRADESRGWDRVEPYGDKVAYYRTPPAGTLSVTFYVPGTGVDADVFRDVFRALRGVRV
jgi:hypothetical protein